MIFFYSSAKTANVCAIDWLLANRVVNVYCHRHWLFCPQLTKRTVARKSLTLDISITARFFRWLISQTSRAAWLAQLYITRLSQNTHYGLLCIIICTFITCGIFFRFNMYIKIKNMYLYISIEYIYIHISFTFYFYGVLIFRDERSSIWGIKCMKMIGN